MRKITNAEAQAFLNDILEVMNKHQLEFSHYTHIYCGEGCQDSGYEIVPFDHGDRYSIRNAHVPKEYRTKE